MPPPAATNIGDLTAGGEGRNGNAPSSPARGSRESFQRLSQSLRRIVPPAPPPLPEATAPPPLPEPARDEAAPLPPETTPEEPPADAAGREVVEIPPPARPRPGDSAVALLDIVWGAIDLQKQERALAGDTLLLLLPRLPLQQLTLVAERVSMMDQPPPLLVSKLLRDPREDIGNLMLERCPHLQDDEVITATDRVGAERLRLLARRRNISPALSDHLINSDDLLSVLALLRNPDARLTIRSLMQLAARAAVHPSLQAPLAMRADLPLAVGLELFWCLPPELRRIVLSRFVSDSETLGRILAIALFVDAEEAVVLTRGEGTAGFEEFDAALEPLVRGRREESARAFARLARLNERTVKRIFADGDGEALVALFKALGLSRVRFDEALDKVRSMTGLIKPARRGEELKAVFDSLSFNMARVLLIYWDWFVLEAGPYAAVD